MSPVVHPAVDFHALALEQFEKFAAQGVRFIDSTDALPFLSAAAPASASDAPVVGLQRQGEWQAENQALAALERAGLG
jgi:hypothetical protein